MILIFLAVLPVIRFCGIEREKEENKMQKNDILWEYRYANLMNMFWSIAGFMVLYSCGHPDQDEEKVPFLHLKWKASKQHLLAMRDIYIESLSPFWVRPAFVDEIENWQGKEEKEIIADILNQTETFEQLTFLFEQWLLTRVEDFNLTMRTIT